MGFGGAFVALADDATAAFANPAGLVQLTEPEVSVEGRVWSHATPYVDGGRIFGPPTDLGLDTIDGLSVGISSTEIGGLSFLSFAFPTDRWTFAIYRHVLANYEFGGEMDSLFAGPWPGFPNSRERTFALRKAIDLELINFGASASYRLNDAVSLGLGVSYVEGSMLLLSESFGFADPGQPTDFYGFHTNFAPEFLVSASPVYGKDETLTYLVGALWRPSETWSLGAVYREGPELGGTSQVIAGPMNRESVPAGTVVASSSGQIGFPDVFGIGAAYRSRTQRLTLSFEWDHVGYSSLLEESPEFRVDDGAELRIGAEYVFLQSTPVLAVRIGAWLDPDHRIRYTGDNYIARAVLQSGSDERHLSFGVGIAMRSFQLDLGVDLSELVDTVSLSTIYTF
jgi:hypothetical protein